MDDPLVVRRLRAPRSASRLEALRRAVSHPARCDPRVSALRPVPSPARSFRPDFSDAEDVGDVRMIQRGEDFGFPLEAREAVGISRDEAGSTLMATWRFRLVSVAR